jgi:hypothetical protein
MVSRDLTLSKTKVLKIADRIRLVMFRVFRTAVPKKAYGKRLIMVLVYERNEELKVADGMRLVAIVVLENRG